MLSTSKIINAKYRFLFITNIVIISEFINHYLKGTNLFSDSWLCYAIAILISYIFYMLILEDFILKFTYTPKINHQVVNLLKLTSLFLYQK